MDEQPQTAVGLAGEETFEKLYADETGIVATKPPRTASDLATPMAIPPSSGQTPVGLPVLERLAYADDDVEDYPASTEEEMQERLVLPHLPWSDAWSRAGAMLAIGVAAAFTVGIVGWAVTMRDPVPQPAADVPTTMSAAALPPVVPPPMVTITQAPPPPMTVTVTPSPVIYPTPTTAPPAYGRPVEGSPEYNDQHFLTLLGMSVYGPRQESDATALWDARQICGLYSRGYSAGQQLPVLERMGIPAARIPALQSSAVIAYPDAVCAHSHSSQ
jgi:hypothetical protein